MDQLLFVLLMVINLGISFWNARVCGQCWVEAKAVGGFIRLLVWCGAIQSAIGFSMIIIVLMALIGGPYLPPEVTKLMLSLWYLMIIVPALGTGFIITVHSWIMAYRERSLANLGAAGWNTFASAYNTYNAVSGIGQVWENVTDGLFSGDGDNKGAMLAILLVVIALCGGILITTMIIKHYAGTVPIPEQLKNRRIR
jgi:hypothetical protein